jgi:hypothetical protein
MLPLSPLRMSDLAIFWTVDEPCCGYLLCIRAILRCVLRQLLMLRCFMLCLIMSCYLMSRHVMSCHHVLSYVVCIILCCVFLCYS